MTDISKPLIADAPTASPRRSGRRLLRDVIVIVVAALLVSFLVKTFLVRAFFIPSASMEDTLRIDDRILVNELAPGIMPLHHGDVIVFHDPGQWLDTDETVPDTNPVTGVLRAVGLVPSGADDALVKRVIGLPGDTVACCDEEGRLTVNGVPVDEPYTLLAPGEPASDSTFSVTVPAGSLWVMGDNRDDSADSRAHVDSPSRGFVPYANVVGRAFAVTWPLGHLTWLDDHASVFARVPGH